MGTLQCSRVFTTGEMTLIGIRTYQKCILPYFIIPSTFSAQASSPLERSRRTDGRTNFFTPCYLSIYVWGITKPGIDYEALRNALRPYAHDSAITNPILQRRQDAARYEIFGTSEENAWYAEGVVEKMQRLGHTTELVYSTRAATLQMINTTVVNEEVIRRKNLEGEHPLDGLVKRKEFWNTWKEEHALFLAEALGMECRPAENKFLTGILVATSVSKTMFQTTHEMVQADGAHTSFGKYTLFSAYTTMANGNMANVAFGILFGNEDIKNWTLF